MSKGCRIAVCAALLGISVTTGGTAPPKPAPGAAGIEILIAGVLRATDVTPSSGLEGWYALSIGNRKTHLDRIRISTKRAMLYTSDPESTGTLISVEAGDSTLFLIRGMTGLVEGPVNTWFLGRQPIDSAARVPLRGKLAQRYVMEGIASYSSWRKIRTMRDSEYLLRIVERESGRTQVLARRSTGSGPVIFWVGDLDRDHRIDFFQRESLEEGPQIYSLYLSTRAADGNIVGEAASLHLGGL